MKFNESPSQISKIESKEKVTIPTQIAWQTQLNLCVKWFVLEYEGDRHAELNIETLGDDVLTWWAEVYAKPFRDYCDEHPSIAQHIVEGNLSEEEELDLVEYIKENPTNADGSPLVVH